VHHVDKMAECVLLQQPVVRLCCACRHICDNNNNLSRIAPNPKRIGRASVPDGWDDSLFSLDGSCVDASLSRLYGVGLACWLVGICMVVSMPWPMQRD
jgi:hypothetical protein